MDNNSYLLSLLSMFKINRCWLDADYIGTKQRLRRHLQLLNLV